MVPAQLRDKAQIASGGNGTLELACDCSDMEHRGMRFELLQMASPSGWKWIVHLGPTKTQTGFSRSKDIAVFAATRAIDNALKARAKEKGNRTDGPPK